VYVVNNNIVSEIDLKELIRTTINSEPLQRIHHIAN